MHIEEHWEKLSRGTTFDAVNSSDIQALLIPIPPLPEQKAIAKVLSDMDELIESIEKLIHKKKQIKQGAMQELLTGKKRLPGFSGKWEVKRLGEIAEIATGSTPPTKDKTNYGDKYLFVSPADLRENKYVWNTEKKLSEKGFRLSRKFPPNTILFTCIGSTIGKTGILPIEATSNQQINAILPNESYSTEFVYYYLSHIALEIKALASEQAVPIINKSTFELIEILLPPLPEQKAIAQILSDMDAEIEALEKKLDKYKKIKEGMMEKLLTGQVRLV
jgi:type I restriction enzyme S subunit